MFRLHVLVYAALQTRTPRGGMYRGLVVVVLRGLRQQYRPGFRFLGRSWASSVLTQCYYGLCIWHCGELKAVGSGPAWNLN